MSCLPMFLRVREGGSACTTLPRRPLRPVTGLEADLRREGKVWSLRHT